MKMWCTLNRNPADRCPESCALLSSFPVAHVSKIFLWTLLALIFPLLPGYFSAINYSFEEDRYGSCHR